MSLSHKIALNVFVFVFLLVMPSLLILQINGHKGHRSLRQIYGYLWRRWYQKWLTDLQTMSPIELTWTKNNSNDRNDKILPIWDVSKCANCQKLGQEAVHFQQARIISRSRNWTAALEVVLNSQLLPKSVISRHWQSGLMDAIAEFCMIWALGTS